LTEHLLLLLLHHSLLLHHARLSHHTAHVWLEGLHDPRSHGALVWRCRLLELTPTKLLLPLLLLLQMDGAVALLLLLLLHHARVHAHGLLLLWLLLLLDHALLHGHHAGLLLLLLHDHALSWCPPAPRHAVHHLVGALLYLAEVHLCAGLLAGLVLVVLALLDEGGHQTRIALQYLQHLLLLLRGLGGLESL
jgi:hypothetical protein